ncbi:MAG TPA: tetratricopeptide repeat protein [Polyangiaceae bacterium]|nr:tetratricopeptide repeat protein [Polyangiaceae bacterium]
MLFPDLPEIDGIVDRPTSADYAVAARFALERKRLPRAIEQISAALALEPLNPEHLRLLTAILEASRAPLELLRLGGDTFFGLIAVRGYALARAGQWSEALKALTAAVLFRPDTPFLVWTTRWLDDERAMRRLNQEDVASLLTQFSAAARRFPNARGTGQNLDAALALAERVTRVQSAHRSLAYARSRLLKTLGETEHAIQVLNELGQEEQTSIEYALERANLAHDQGKRAERLTWLTQAAGENPELQSTWFELGDAQLELGALAEALGSYEKGLALGPSERGQATKDYLRWLLFGDGELLSRSAAESDAHRRRLQEDALGYDQLILDPLDPLVRVIRGTLMRAESLPVEQRIRLRVQAERPLSPSAELAFQHGLASLGRVGELEVEHAPARQRLAGIWERRGGKLVPLHQPLSDEVMSRFSEAALRPFSWTVFMAGGNELALLATDPVEFLGVVGHPPAVPRGADGVEWVCRVELLAAFAIAMHSAPWSERERLLVPMASSDDWISVAGVLALVVAAERDPSRRSDVLRELEALIPVEGAELPACARALAIGGSRVAEGDEVRTYLELRARAMMASVAP